MVRAPEYEEMDGARSEAVPGAFRDVFGNDSGYALKEEKPDTRGPIPAGPISRSTYHIYKGHDKAATIYQNGHIEIIDETIRDKLEMISAILEEAANLAYEHVVRHSR